MTNSVGRLHFVYTLNAEGSFVFRAVFSHFFGHAPCEVIFMPKKKAKRKPPENPRLDPEQRLAPQYDSASIAKYPVAEPGKMGFRVLDDFPEEHIQ